MFAALCQRNGFAEMEFGRVVAAGRAGGASRLVMQPLLPSEVATAQFYIFDGCLVAAHGLRPVALAGRFAAAQQAGQLNPDLDPRLLMVSLIGLTMFPMASAPIWRQLFGADDIDFNDLRRHTLVLLDRGLELDHAK